MKIMSSHLKHKLEVDVYSLAVSTNKLSVIGNYQRAGKRLQGCKQAAC